MPDKIEIITIIFSLGLLVVILFLVSSKRLRLQYSLLWFFTFAFIILLSLFPRMLDKISFLAGINYTPSLLFLLAFLFLLLIVLHYSVVISTLFETNKGLIQKISIMDYKIKELNKRIEELNK